MKYSVKTIKIPKFDIFFMNLTMKKMLLLTWSGVKDAGRGWRAELGGRDGGSSAAVAAAHGQTACGSGAWQWAVGHSVVSAIGGGAAGRVGCGGARAVAPARRHTAALRPSILV